MRTKRVCRTWGAQVFAALIAPLLLAACAEQPTLPNLEPPPPPAASARKRIRPEVAATRISPGAERLAHDLLGKTFTDEDGSFGGGEWTVGVFADDTYPTTAGKSRRGANLIIEQDDKRKHLPMEADGDAGDLYRRAVGAEARGFGGLPGSAAYKAALTKPPSDN